MGTLGRPRKVTDGRMTAFVLDLQDYWGDRSGEMTPTWALRTCLRDPAFHDSIYRLFVSRMSAATFYKKFRYVQDLLRNPQWGLETGPEQEVMEQYLLRSVASDVILLSGKSWVDVDA